MRGSKEAARRRFDRWAGRYERDRRSRFNARPRERALALLDLRPGDCLLDVGCGTGAAVRTAAATCPAVGVDLSPEMIRRARELAAEQPDARFVVGDSERLPFMADEFTAVLCSASFHHYPHPEQALAEMARVLRPGGRLALADGMADNWAARAADQVLRVVDRSHVRLYRSTELRRMLAAVGFAGIEVDWVYAGGLGIVTARSNG